MRQNGQGCPLVMLFRQSGQIFLACLIVAQKQRRRFGKGPCEMSVPDLCARGPQAFATRCLRTCAQATVRSKVLHAGETFDLVDCVEQHEAEDLANARHGLQQVQGMSVMGFGRLDDREFYVAQQLIVLRDQCQVDLDGLLDSRVGKALGDTLTVGLVGNFLAALGQVRLAVGILHMG